jgi:PAS domain S-box-containing protein
MANDDRIRVLLVDDDEAAFALTQAILGQIPGAVLSLEWVSTLEEGRAAIARREHDVYLIDYLIGEKSGIELVREARASLNRAPMILLTGKGRYEVDVEAMEAGVSDYLDKTKVDPDLMERSIRYAMERVRAEAALRDSEERHRSMFDHLPIGLYRTSTDGRLLDANPSLVQLLGHPDRDTLEFEYARNFFVNPAHRESFLDRLDQFGVVRGFESELKRPDGRLLRVRTAARAHRSPEGETLYLEGAVEDVSDQYEARDVHAQAAGFDWIWERSGLAILLLDLAGVVLKANPTSLRAFGYKEEELLRQHFEQLCHEEDRAALRGEIARVASGQPESSEAQRMMLAADGEPLWARTRTGLVRDLAGRPDHLMVLLEDVAEG